MTALARRCGLSLLLLLAVARVAPAQGFDAWFDARIEALIDEAAVAANGTTADRQRDAPAGDRSASLVDQSSATDFVSAAINLAAVLNPKAADGTSPPGGENTGAQSITTSLYALVAGFNGTSPTDPEFYKRHVNARRFSFTIGTAESDKEKHNTDKPATVVGAKLLLLTDATCSRRAIKRGPHAPCLGVGPAADPVERRRAVRVGRGEAHEEGRPGEADDSSRPRR